MKVFDLILVLEYSRSVPYYLSLIKTLSSKYKIAVFRVPVEESLLNKTGQAQAQFEELCVEYGATLIRYDEIEENLKCQVCLIPQRSYTQEALKIIKSQIQAQEMVAALTLAWPGLNDQFIRELNISRLFVVDQKFMDFLLTQRGDRQLYHSRTLTEVGIPFGKYPLFPEFSTDYLVAMPTMFSFPHESDKWEFLKTLLRFFTNISPTDLVVHKTHNGNDYDLFSSTKVQKLSKLLAHIPGIENLLIFLASFASIFGKLATGVLYTRVKARSTPLHEITPYNDLGVEIFFAGTRKGVIGGLSNTIWGALYYKLPFYNCVDISIQRRGDKKNRVYGDRNPAQLLDTNLKYFLVPYCAGNVEFDSKYFDIVSESTRSADMVQEVEKLLRPDSSRQLNV